MWPGVKCQSGFQYAGPCPEVYLFRSSPPPRGVRHVFMILFDAFDFLDFTVPEPRSPGRAVRPSPVWAGKRVQGAVRGVLP
jgi:hypothetical protein